MTEFITDRDIYERVIRQAVPTASEFVWIGTANLKDLYVDHHQAMLPFLHVLSELVESGVSIRLLHSREPGPAFMEEFDRFPNLIEGLERIHCPRVHFKCVIVDGRFAYTGSANLTGAGMGAKSQKRRNFESGLITEDPALIQQIMDQFDGVWMGAHCAECDRKEHCSDYHELLPDE